MGRFAGALIGVAVAALLALGIAGCAGPAGAWVTHGSARLGADAHRTSGRQRVAAATTRPSTTTSPTTGSAGAGQATPDQEVKQPYRMLFVGASITAGIGASSTSDSFPYVLGAEVQRVMGPVQETVVATPGAPVRRALQWPLPADQNLVVVHMVTNDYLQGTPVLQYESGLLTLLRRIRAGSPHATLICLGAWASADRLNAEDVGPAAYNRADQAACQAEGGYFVPLQQFYGRRHLHDPMPLSPELRSVLGVSDLGGKDVAFHPSNAGDYAIAQAIYGVLERNNSLQPTDSDGNSV